MAELTKERIHNPAKPGFILKDSVENYEKISRGESPWETTDRESRMLIEGISFSSGPIDERSTFKFKTQPSFITHTDLERLIQETGIQTVTTDMLISTLTE